ncbi:hypothetical protein SAMD00019534_084410, partial [Acytostelium subglobosum LB1]|uniref:hypothetical protein n=1 Tax=Acytostelium subglobosum LB1 TaxID=1410327 RepID=UPI000644B57C
IKQYNMTEVLDNNNNTMSVESTQTQTQTSTTTITCIKEMTDIGAVLLSQGAEAKTYRYILNGMECIVKERFVKKYRHQLLDAKIQAKRLLMEVRNINKCRRHQIPVPTLYFIDTVSNRIYMEYVDGQTVKQYLWDNKPTSALTSSSTSTIITSICRDIGRLVAKMHDNNVIHGDLTTSNILLRNGSGEDSNLVFIDFGLSYVSTMQEDKAVDLFVLERAFISTHPDSESLFSSVLEGYASYSNKTKQILDKLDQVRLRGRKKLAFG